jgi:hypothetical protein
MDFLRALKKLGAASVQNNSGSPARRATRKPRFEALHARVLPAADVTFVDGVLTIQDNVGEANDIVVEADANGWLIVKDGATVKIGAGVHLASAVTQIIIDLNGGDDAVDLSDVKPADFPNIQSVEISLGSGDDTATGSWLADLIEGGLGNGL